MKSTGSYFEGPTQFDGASFVDGNIRSSTFGNVISTVARITQSALKVRF